MKETIKSFDQIVLALYNQYILTDFMGYLLPGALLIFNLNYYLNFLEPFREHLSKTVFVKKYFTPFFFLGICYMTGHMISGYFFNGFIGIKWWPFRYLPYEYVHDNITQMKFEMDYQSAVKILNNNAIGIGQERFALLKHMTGFMSSTLVLLVIVNMLFFYKHYREKQIMRGIAFIVIPLFFSLGLYLNHRQLIERQYWYRENIILQGKYKNENIIKIDSLELNGCIDKDTIVYRAAENLKNDKILWFRDLAKYKSSQ